MAFSLDKGKNQVKDIQKNIEKKKGESESLERSKEEILRQGMEIQGSNLEEGSKKTAMEGVNLELTNISERGKEIADEMNADFTELETLRENTQTSLESNQEESKKLEQKKEFPSKFGLGKGLESSLDGLADSRKSLEDFFQTVNETRKDLETVQHKLGNL